MLEQVNWAQSFWSVRQRYAANLAVDDGQETITHLELARRTAGLAEALAAAGAGSGTRVCIHLGNTIDAVVTGFAALLTGICEVPVAASAPPEEVARCLDITGAKLAVCNREHAAGLEALGIRCIVPSEIAPLDLDRARFASVPAAVHSRIAFTSGSTGQPKPIVHSHGGRWLSGVLQRATLPFRPDGGSRLLAMTPYTHGAALLCFAFLDHGGGVELVDGVDLGRVRPLILDGGVDAIFAPPTVLAKLTAALKGERVRTVRAIFTGTAPLAPSVYAAARDVFGPVVRITYGKTEVFNPITVLDAEETDRFYKDGGGDSNCVGWPEAGVDLRILGPGNEVLPVGEEGEVFVAAQHMSLGTLREDRLEPWPAEGHATGDLGYLDACGRLHIVGRKSDAIKSGGYKLYPAEVERVIAGATGREDIVVVGLPSDYWGEVVTAVTAAAWPDWQEEVKAACAGLPRHKRPRLFATLPQLPRNAQLKIVRRQVVAQLRDNYTFTDGPYPALSSADDGGR